MSATIRVELPAPLCALANLPREVHVCLDGVPTQTSVLDALERSFPALRGTLRDQRSNRRRPFIRFFACQKDLSHEAPDTALPHEVCEGSEPFLIIGAIAGG